MYRRRTDGWVKHLDFIALDLICLQLSFVLAYCIRHGLQNLYLRADYRSMGLFIAFVDFILILLGTEMDDIVKRGFWQEAKSCAKSAVLVTLLSAFYLFSIQGGEPYSRTVMYLTGVIYWILNFLARSGWKAVLHRRGGSRKKDAMLVAAKQARMDGVLQTLSQNSFDMPAIKGLILLDGSVDGQYDYPYPVVADQSSMTEFITRSWVDELLVDEGSRADLRYLDLQKQLDQIAGSGVAVHRIIFADDGNLGRPQLVEHVGGFTVLTDSIRIVSMRQAVFKRCLDIAGGLAGCVLAGLALLVVGPIIWIQSPGPVIFRQTRIGRNGKPFTMYKIRSMCMDAEEKKKELAAANRVAGGMMFKLDFDPRIIGAKQLPDGTVKKGIGNFIRDYSVDELPQFFNVLKGDMSLVGTRPPTLDEWEKYQPNHRARMTFRPGITGLWQISGRSDITDFDEVIRLDMKYINEWDAGRDFRIMLETVRKVLHKDGAR